MGTNDKTLKTEYLAIEKIYPDKNQPRKKTGFGKEEIEELSNSIREVGIIVPLLIQNNGVLIDGERRWKAAKLLGLNKVPVVYNEDMNELQRLEYQLIASLNSTSCAEEEIAPKIKEYIDKSGFSNVVAATRLGKTEGYIRTMINQLADLSKDEKDIIKLWRDTKGEKGMAPSNLAEAKQIHPEKVEELIEIAKEEVVSRSDIRQIAKEKKDKKDIEDTNKKAEEIKSSKDSEIKVKKTEEMLSDLRTKIDFEFQRINKLMYLVGKVRKTKLYLEKPKEKENFFKYIGGIIDRVENWSKELRNLRDNLELEIIST